MKLLRLAAAVVMMVAFPLCAFAQQAILQGGPWAPGRAPMYVGSGSSQPILQDSGPAGGGSTGLGLSEQLLQMRSTNGTYPAANAGTGPSGTNWCDYDAPITNATGYHYLCLGPNAAGGGLLTYGAGGGASPLPFQTIINGVSIPVVGSINGIQYVVDNTALQALSTASAAAVMRLDYAPGNGAPPLVYQATASACSLNGGAGDNGSQVRGANGNCWIARKPAKGMDVRQWGCTAASSDNTACIQAAINAQYKDTLLIVGGPYITGPLSATDQIIIIGSGGDNGIYTNTCTAGLRQKDPNTDVLVLHFGGTVQSLCIDQKPGAVNSAGGFGLRSIAATAFIPSTSFISNTVYQSCNGISVTATPAGQMLEPLILGNLSVPYPDNGCNAYLIGDLSINSQTGNVKFIGNSTYCGSNKSTGLMIKDSGGLYAQDNITGYACNISMSLTPGVNQFVNYSQIGMGPMADTSVTAGILIDPQASSSVMFDNAFNGTWASNTTNGPTVMVRNTGATPSAIGLDFRNMTSLLGNNQSGFDLGGTWSDISIQNNTICNTNAGNPGTGIIVGGAVSNVTITGNKIASCGGFAPGILATGISITTSASDIGMVEGNNFGSPNFPITTPINFSPSGSLGTLRFVLGDNKGITDITPGFITTAASISLPINHVVFLTGGGTISNMIGPTWSGKTVTIRLQSASTVNFATGGAGATGICNIKTITQFQSVTATYSAGDTCWFLQGP